MEPGTEEYELNGDLRPGSPGSPDASVTGTGMAGFSSMLEQLVRPAGLPDLWLGGPATLESILLYILGEAISMTQDQTPEPPRWGWRNRPINVNHYANKKSAAESMLDIALLMANASQLKAVVEQGHDFAFFVPLVVLISISLVLQIGVGVLLIFLVKYDLNNPAKHAKLDFLNNLATGLVFIIVVVNIFITAFGVQKPVMDVAPRQ
ncbi:ninjurin-1 isoform X2 [Microtus pennsylvanicus]|uniref:ninjurin-1 isoform X2 n=1 Tax=Microtus pennsylvanicus TaxID=10058 RepID=UPI003F6D2267